MSAFLGYSYASERPTPQNESESPDIANYLHVQASLSLSPITPLELTGEPGDIALPMNSWPMGMDLSNPSPIATKIVREVPTLWRARLKKDTGHIAPAWNIRYKLIAADGYIGALSHIQVPNSRIMVTIRPLPPRTVVQKRTYIEVEGGAIFEMNISSAFVAGTYSGTLQIIQDLF